MHLSERQWIGALQLDPNISAGLIQDEGVIRIGIIALKDTEYTRLRLGHCRIVRSEWLFREEQVELTQSIGAAIGAVPDTDAPDVLDTPQVDFPPGLERRFSMGY